MSLSTICRSALISSVAAAALVVAPGVAAADDSRSYPGCPLLLEGMSGACVERLQMELNAVEPAHGLAEDGYFGAGTRIAVLDFQGRNGLGADGNVGSVTADLLSSQVDYWVASPVPSSPSGPGLGGGGAEDPIGDEIELFCSPIPLFGGVCEYLFEADPAY